MAKFTKSNVPPQLLKGKAKVDPKAAAADKMAKGKMTPVQAAKMKHAAPAVLGKNDSKYHGTGC